MSAELAAFVQSIYDTDGTGGLMSHYGCSRALVYIYGKRDGVKFSHRGGWSPAHEAHYAYGINNKRQRIESGMGFNGDRMDCKEGRSWPESGIVKCACHVEGQCAECNRGYAASVEEVGNRRATTLQQTRESAISSVMDFNPCRKTHKGGIAPETNAGGRY